MEKKVALSVPTRMVATKGLVVWPPRSRMATITNVAQNSVASEGWRVSRMERLATVS
jgi:hypothetical protein